MSVWFLSKFTEQDTQTPEQTNQQQEEMAEVSTAQQEAQRKVQDYMDDVPRDPVTGKPVSGFNWWESDDEDEQEQQKQPVPAPTTAAAAAPTTAAAAAPTTAQAAAPTTAAAAAPTTAQAAAPTTAQAAAHHQGRQRPAAPTTAAAAAHHQGRQRPAAPTTAAAPAHQGRPRRQRPATASAGLRGVAATVAATVSTMTLATTTVFIDPEVLLKYVGCTLQGLWNLTKDVWFEGDLFKRVAHPFYGKLWMTCPKDDADKFLLFKKDDPMFTKTKYNLKEDYKSFVVVIAYHCVYNVTALGRFLRIRCMFNDKNEIDDEFRTFMMNVIKGYIAKYSNSSIIDNFDKCVQYIRNHDGVDDKFKNDDDIIKLHIKAVDDLIAEAIKNAPNTAIVEMRDDVAKINETVAEMKTDLEKMKKTQEQNAQRLDAVHTEVVELRRTVNVVAEANNRAMKMFEQCGPTPMPPPMTGCVPMLGVPPMMLGGVPMLPMGCVPPTQRVDDVWRSRRPRQTGGQPQ